ncbi:head GIN domain-containing protein [Sphingomonas aerolata]|uniref:head GIN domain-containing protein n=1 Tax=Sphingomonas aerolata TaxID=185951 RepID=UPI00141B3347|nr:head GIN domain-containing protein [Sphingomonas aerolata]
MKYLALGLIIPLAACSFSWSGDDDGAGASPSGTGTTRTYMVSDFSTIDLRGASDVDVRVGTGFSVRAQGPAEALDRLTIERDGDTLEIGRRKGVNLNWGRSGKVKVFVTLPRLAAAAISGSGDMTVDRVEGTRFAADVAGSGSLGVAAVKVDDLAVSIAGSGSVSAAGSARALAVEIAGSGDVDAAGLKARSARVEIAGSGSVRAVVDGPATVDMMGSGDVDLGSAARCTVSKMGSGSVRCAP